MIYFIFIFGIMIIGTLAFIASIKIPPKIELKFAYHTTTKVSYDLVELVDPILYLPADELQRMHFGSDLSKELIVSNDTHLNRIIEERVRILVRQMLKEGLVEIIHFEDHDYEFFPRKKVILKLRIYRKEATHLTAQSLVAY